MKIKIPFFIVLLYIATEAVEKFSLFLFKNIVNFVNASILPWMPMHYLIFLHYEFFPFLE